MAASLAKFSSYSLQDICFRLLVVMAFNILTFTR